MKKSVWITYLLVASCFMTVDSKNWNISALFERTQIQRFSNVILTSGIPSATLMVAGPCTQIFNHATASKVKTKAQYNKGNI